VMLARVRGMLGAMPVGDKLRKGLEKEEEMCAERIREEIVRVLGSTDFVQVD
jgi:hypothetical protein